MVGLLSKLREKSFRRELQKAKKSKVKLKKKAVELVKIEEMQNRLNRERGVKGLSKAEKTIIKKKMDKLAKRKKATKKALKIASKIALKGAKETLRFIFTEPKKKKTTRKRKTKRKKK